MKKIKIAQIGVGHDHASAIFSTLNNMKDVFDFVGYAEVPEDNIDYEWWKNRYKSDMEKVYKGAKKFTVEEILSMPDLDAVAIETFDLNLVKYAQMAVDRGINIHMDKAPGESYQEFEKLLSSVKENGVAFSIGYMYRYNPLIEKVFEQVKNGELGKIHSIDAEMSCFYGPDKRQWLDQFQGGMMQYLGCHLVDLVVRLQGVPDEIIPYNMATGADGVDAKDNTVAVLKYANGVSLVKSSMLDSCGFVRRHLTVHGEKGTIHICPLEDFSSGNLKSYCPHSTFLTHHTPSDGWNGKGVSVRSEDYDRYEGMMLHFAKVVRGESPIKVDLETEARVERCLLSADGIPCDYKAKIEL